MDIQRILAELRKEQRNLNRAIAALEKLPRRQKAEKLEPVRLSKKRSQAIRPVDKRRTQAEIIAFPQRARRASSRMPLIVDSRR